MKQHLVFNFSKFFGDLISMVTGYFGTPTDGIIASKVGSLLEIGLPTVSQPVVDEIVKAFAAIAITVVSRIVFDRVDKWRAKRKISGSDHYTAEDIEEMKKEWQEAEKLLKNAEK